MQQFGERRADRLSGVAFVVEKARAGIDLEAEELAVGRLLEVDPGEEQVERAREPQARRFHGRRQGDRLEPGGQAVEMGVAVVDRVGLDPGGEDPLADGVHADVAARNEGLKLRRPVAEQIEARELVGAEAAHDRADAAGRLVDHLAVLGVKRARRGGVAGDERRRHAEARAADESA